MMKKLICVFAFFLSITNAYTQSFEIVWDTYFPAPQGSYGYSILSTHDQNIMMAGFAADSDMWQGSFILKADTGGNKIWSVYPSLISPFDTPKKLIEDNEQNYVFVGNDYATLFCKASSLGELITTTTNGGSNEWSTGNDVVQTIDGGYLIFADSSDYAGVRKVSTLGEFGIDSTFFKGQFLAMDKVNDSVFAITGHNNTTGKKEIILTKLKLSADFSTELLLGVSFPIEISSEWGKDILVLPDNEGYIICGYGNGGVIMRTDLNGKQIWKKTANPDNQPQFGFKTVLLDQNSHLLVLAGSNDTSKQIMLLKFDLNGHLIQSSYLQFNINDFGADITIDQSGAIFLTGASKIYSQTQSALLSKIKDLCQIESPIASLPDTVQSIYEEVVVKVTNTFSGWNYKLILLSDSTILKTVPGNGGAVEINAGTLTQEAVAEGLMVTASRPDRECIFNSDTLYVLLSDMEEHSNQEILVYPNPFRNEITIKKVNPYFRINRLTIYDINGVKLFEEFSFNNNIIDMKSLSVGVFLLEVEDSSGKIIRQKIIKY